MPVDDSDGLACYKRAYLQLGVFHRRQHLIDLLFPSAFKSGAEFNFASRSARPSKHWPSGFVLLPNLQAAVIVVEKMEGNPGSIFIREVGFRAVRHTVAEKHDTARLQFDGDGAMFRRIASDVMVAKRIAVMVVRFSVAARDHVKATVFNVCVVNRNPHRDAAQRVGNFEISVVLMPVRADAYLGRLPEGLIQFQHEIVPDELLHDRQRFRVEDERLVEIASIVQRNHLEVLSLAMIVAFCPIRLNGAVNPSAVFEFDIVHSLQFKAKRPRLPRREESFKPDAPVVSEPI